MKPTNKIVVSVLMIMGLSLAIIYWNPEREESESAKQNLWTSKTHASSGQDMVIYGDSRVYRGFSTEHFIGDTDIRCHNFGYSSASFSQRMLDFCERQLRDEKSGDYVFGITPHAFTKSAISDKHFKQEFERSQFDVTTRLAKTEVLQYFDPITANDFLGLSIETETFHPDGWVSKNNVKFDTLAGLESYTKTFSKTEIDTNTYEQFFKFVEAEVQKGRQVYAYRPPTMPSMDELEEEMTAFSFDDFISRFETSGGIWIDVSRTAYETYDGSHITTQSTIQLSEFLGQQILKN